MYAWKWAHWWLECVFVWWRLIGNEYGFPCCQLVVKIGLCIQITFPFRTSSWNRDWCLHVLLCCMLLYLQTCLFLRVHASSFRLQHVSIFCCTCLTSFRMYFTHWACVPIASIACQQLGWFVSFVLEYKRQQQVDVTLVNLLLPHSYQTGYWRADKARMSSVSPEESPLFNCSSLLTTSRDQDSECVRLGPAGWWGWELERRGTVGGNGFAPTYV